jgi:hypothetical protein
MNKLINIFSLLLTVVLVGCSGPSGETPAKFKVAFGAIGTSNFPGGLVVYGVSQDKAFGRVLTTESTDEFVPNGNWSFYAMAWRGSSDMSGTVECAFQGGVQLNGTPVEIDLTVMNTTCQGSLFASAVNTNANGDFEFQNFKLLSCNQKGVNDIASASYVDATCSYDPLAVTPKNGKGYALSYKIMLKAYNRTGSTVNLLAPQLESACIAVKSSDVHGDFNITNEQILNNLNIPTGAANAPFATVIRAYFTNDCDASLQKGFKDILLPNGIAGQSFHHKHYSPPNSGDPHKLFVRVDEVDTCKAPRLAVMGTLGTNIFSAGSGLPESPHVICSAAQLNSIGLSEEYAESSFILAQDIDLHPFRKMNGGTVPCTSDLENFYPIGGYTSNCGLGADSAPLYIYSGTFDGNFKKISNIHLNKPGLEGVGFIRQLNQGNLLNTTFEKIMLNGSEKVGLVSLATGATLNIIKGIHVKNGSYNSRGDGAGGLVGESQNVQGLSIQKSKVKNVKVISHGNYAGGLVGLGKKLNIIECSFDGEVIATGENKEGIGGIWGKAYDGDNQIDQVAFDGLIKSTLSYRVGGIGGSLWGSSNTISNVAVRGLVQNLKQTNNPELGGVIGYLNDTLQLSNGIFNGYLDFACINGTSTNCKVGGAIGNAFGTASISGFYSNYNYASNFGGSDGSSSLDEDSMINASAFGSIINSFNSEPPYPWKTMINNANPRLSFEDEHICYNSNNVMSLVQQAQSQRGTISNPFVICNRSQFKNIKNYLSSHFKIADHIYMGILESTDMALNFNGSIDGTGKIIYGAEFEAHASNFSGLIGSTSQDALLKNINVHALYAKENASTTNTSYVGGLVGRNLGVIQNVKVEGVSNVPVKFGMIAGENLKNLIDVYAEGKIEGEEEIAGITAKNHTNANIKFAHANTYILASANGFNLLAGITASNQGTISESMFNGKITTLNPGGAGPFSPASEPKVSFIAGINEGNIVNTIANYNARLETTANQFIGGLSAVNAINSSITKSLNLGTIYIESNTPTSTTGSVIGQNSGTQQHNFFHVRPYKAFAGNTGLTLTATQTESAGSCTIAHAKSGISIGTGAAIADRIIYYKNNSGQSVFLNTTNTNSTYDGNDFSISYKGACISNPAIMNFNPFSEFNILLPSINVIGEEIQRTEFSKLETYCANTNLNLLSSEEKNNFTCSNSNGIDIIDLNHDQGAVGTRRFRDYYNAILTGQTPPNNSPIWIMSDKFPYAPELVQLKKY